MPSAITPLANVTLGSAVNSVTFSSISSAYRDLILVITGGSGSFSSFEYRFNGSSSGYTWVGMEANGSTAAAASNTSTALDGNYNYWVEDIGTSNTVYEMQLLDYSATDKHKMAIYKVRAATTGVASYTGRWANTAAVTQVVVSRAGGNTWRTGSTFALYGVSA